MFEKQLPTGYDLYEPFENQWVLDFKNGSAFHGSLKDIGKYMVKSLGFDIKEIDLAIQAIIKGDLNAAHFGMHGTFMYPFQKDIVLNKLAG